MNRSLIAVCATLVLAGCTPNSPFQTAASNAQTANNAQSLMLAQYLGGGGGPYWAFELTGNGSGFTMKHPGPGTSSANHVGTITSQTDLSGGNWLIEGQVGSQPITVLIERRGPGGCSDGHVVGDDMVRVVWDGYLYKGCGDLT